MNITTAQDVALIGCCSCQPALCESPRKECQSISVESTSADDDYTDALAEWNAADPETRGDAPTAPEGYFDFIHGSWGPFVQPLGEVTDDVPSLYRELTSSSGMAYTGAIKFYYAIAGTEFSNSANTFVEWSAAEDQFEYTAIQRVYDWGVNVGVDGGWEVRVIAEDTGTEGMPAIPAPFAWIDVDPPVSPPCTSTLRIRVSMDRYAEDGGSAIDVPTLPIIEDPEGDDYPEGWTPANDWEWSDVTEKTQETDELSSGVTKADLIARATAKMPAGWEEPEGEVCSSSVETTWPIISSFFSGADPEADPPVPATWPDCSSELLPIESIATATVTKSRYRMGIPDGARWEATTAEWLAWEEAGSVGEEPLKTTFDVAHAAWVIAKAEWDAADPETRGEEPLEPTTRSTYELEWDEVFFSEEWEEWKVLKDAFDAATIAYDAWVAAGSEGEAPPIPEEPDPEPTSPSLVASRSWVYSGAEEWSSWFEIAIPTVSGETRVVNIMIICYRSASLGQKPTAYGERYKF
jgi:hypothetical protein